jgi:hypothetical protein
MRSDDAEVDEDDDRGNREPIADDGERPCVSGIPLEDQPAPRTALEVAPAVEQLSLAAMRTALPQPTAKRGSGHSTEKLT